MANTSNNFLKGKMNKDLDARLIPSGEYRNAVNVQVSKSEGSSVGSLENVLGNTLGPKDHMFGHYCFVISLKKVLPLLFPHCLLITCFSQAQLM